MPWPLRMVMYASIIQLVILIYFGIKYFLGLKALKVQSFRLPALAFLLPSALFLIYPVLGYLQFQLYGTFSRTGYPTPIIYLFWFGLVYSVTMLSWLLTIDVAYLISKFVFKSKKSSLKPLFAKLLFGIALTMLLYTGGKMIWDTHRIEFEEISYTLPDDNSLEPLTIVHIADLHADPFTDEKKLSRYISKVNEAEPDVVIFAGDLITSGTDYIQTGAYALGRIESTYGVYAVIGDHDFWVNEQQVADALIEQGITVLRDENVWINHNNEVIKITGVTELYSRQVAEETLRTLFDESRQEKLSILSSHQATDRLIDFAREAEVNQFLAGHTHGGQIRIPVFFYPVTAARAETKYVHGNWKLDDMLLNINSGLGFTLAPVRYHAPAEISVIKVQEQ